MAWLGAAISASDLALRALDKPLLVGRNWLRDATTDPVWVPFAGASTGVWADTDQTATGFGTVRLSDNYSHLLSKPDDSEDVWYLLIDLGATTRTLDYLALLRPEASFAGTQIDVQIADDNGYSSRLVTVATKTPTSDTARVVFDELFDTGTTPLRYSGVRWMRIKFTGVQETPTFGELIIGRSRQLKHSPNIPYDVKHLTSRSDTFESMSGIVSRYTHHKNRKNISATISAYEDAFTSDFETFWEDDIDGGTLPFLWIEKPNSAPTEAYWMMYKSPDLVASLDGWVKRTYNIEAVEQGPHFLGNET